MNITYLIITQATTVEAQILQYHDLFTKYCIGLLICLLITIILLFGLHIPKLIWHITGGCTRNTIKRNENKLKYQIQKEQKKVYIGKIDE